MDGGACPPGSADCLSARTRCDHHFRTSHAIRGECEQISSDLSWCPWKKPRLSSLMRGLQYRIDAACFLEIRIFPFVNLVEAVMRSYLSLVCASFVFDMFALCSATHRSAGSELIPCLRARARPLLRRLHEPWAWPSCKDVPKVAVETALSIAKRHPSSSHHQRPSQVCLSELCLVEASAHLANFSWRFKHNSLQWHAREKLC